MKRKICPLRYKIRQNAKNKEKESSYTVVGWVGSTEGGGAEELGRVMRVEVKRRMRNSGKHFA